VQTENNLGQNSSGEENIDEKQTTQRPHAKPTLQELISGTGKRVSTS